MKHIEHLEAPRFHALRERHALGEEVLVALHNIGTLLQDWNRLEMAERMYLRVLAGREKALGPDHTSTLDTVNNLGLLYSERGTLNAAEQMYNRALAGKENAWGLDHTSTLQTVNNLGNLYHDQAVMK